MNRSPVFRPHDEDLAEAALHAAQACGAWIGLDAFRFEIVSRGDFVPGRLYLPSDTPAPLLLVAHPTGGSIESPALTCCADWVKAGLAVALIDLPLHGARSSPKLSARLVLSLQHRARGEALDLDSLALVEEFSRQSTSDLVRTLDALCARAEIDPQRVGFLGIGVGATVGSYLLAHDRRPQAAVLAHAGAGTEPTALDPATYLVARHDEAERGARESTLLCVDSETDEWVSKASAQAFFEAADEPKRLVRGKGAHGAPAPETLDEIGRFLLEQLLDSAPS